MREKTFDKDAGQGIIEIGQFFKGAPYAAGTLEVKGAERLVTNLREYDCFTFVETTVALTWLIRSRETSFRSFRKLLQKIRYRKGRLEGFPSRLHYFSDWIDDNQRKGILRDVTADLGGSPFAKATTFMTAHPDLYPPLKNADSVRKIRRVEKRVSARRLFYIPKKTLRSVEPRIHAGDVIGITTEREGLDVQHAGFAARIKSRVHLLHASSVEGRVVLSKETLCSYLMRKRDRSGIMVARVRG